MDKTNEWIKHMQHMSKRYETNNGCKTARTKWTNLYIKIIKFTLIPKRNY